MHAQAEHGQHCCDDTVLMTKGESDNSSTGGNPGKVILRHGRQECLQIQPRGAPEGKSEREMTGDEKEAEEKRETRHVESAVCVLTVHEQRAHEQ